MSKLAIITGAGQGIGEGIAHRLAKAGYAIAVADINQSTATKVAQDLQAAGYSAKPYLVDVANRKQVFQLITDAVADLGELAVYVNNAALPLLIRLSTLIQMTSNVYWMLISRELIGEFKLLPHNLKNRAMVAALSMLHPLLATKHLHYKVLILLQNLGFVD